MVSHVLRVPIFYDRYSTIIMASTTANDLSSTGAAKGASHTTNKWPKGGYAAVVRDHPAKPKKDPYGWPDVADFPLSWGTPSYDIYVSPYEQWAKIKEDYDSWADRYYNIVPYWAQGVHDAMQGKEPGKMEAFYDKYGDDGWEIEPEAPVVDEAAAAADPAKQWGTQENLDAWLGRAVDGQSVLKKTDDDWVRCYPGMRPKQHVDQDGWHQVVSKNAQRWHRGRRPAATTPGLRQVLLSPSHDLCCVLIHVLFQPSPQELILSHYVVSIISDCWMYFGCTLDIRRMYVECIVVLYVISLSDVLVDYCAHDDPFTRLWFITNAVCLDIDRLRRPPI